MLKTITERIREAKMRKSALFLVLAVFVLAPAFASGAYIESSKPASVPLGPGFTGPFSGSMADSVAKALTLEDGAPVALIGNIVSQKAGSKNKYVFRDQSGEIAIEAGKKVFGKLSVTPQDSVLISGKIDRDFGKTAEIDVNVLKILK